MSYKKYRSVTETQLLDLQKGLISDLKAIKKRKDSSKDKKSLHNRLIIKEKIKIIQNALNKLILLRSPHYIPNKNNSFVNYDICNNAYRKQLKKFEVFIGNKQKLGLKTV